MKYEISKKEFDRIWDLHTQPVTDDNNYNDAKVHAESIISAGYQTRTGESVSFDLLFERYKRHVYVRNMKNADTPEKFRKKENAVEPLNLWLYKKMWMDIENPPKTQKHFYFWDLLSEDVVKQQYNIFKAICAK